MSKVVLKTSAVTTVEGGVNVPVIIKNSLFIHILLILFERQMVNPVSLMNAAVYRRSEAAVELLGLQ